MTTTPVTDGRSRRSERTRNAVLDALLALLRTGNLRPTAREIAAEAGVSLRSVYVHFEDLDDLFVAAADRQFQQVRHLVVEVATTGPLRERADALVRARGRIYEGIGGVRQAAAVHAPFSPALAGRLATVRELARAELERVFAVELDACPAAQRRERLAVLEVLSGSETWDHLRTSSGMDEGATCAAITGAVVALLGAVE